MHQSPSMSFLIHESAEEYHAKAKHYLSSHQLADFRKCPQLYYRKKNQTRTQEESPADLVGRAAHLLILEGPSDSAKTSLSAALSMPAPDNHSALRPKPRVKGQRHLDCLVQSATIGWGEYYADRITA